MCRELIQDLKACNQELDEQETLPLEERVRVLESACLRTRMALQHLAARLLEGSDELGPQQKAAFERFLDELPALTKPSRSEGGEAAGES